MLGGASREPGSGKVSWLGKGHVPRVRPAQQVMVVVGLTTTGVYEPGPMAVGSVVEGLPGVKEGSMGVLMGVGEPPGSKEGSMGVLMPRSQGAIRLGMRSRSAGTGGANA